MDLRLVKIQVRLHFLNPNEKEKCGWEVHLMSNNLPSIAKLAAKHGIVPLKKLGQNLYSMKPYVIKL